MHINKILITLLAGVSLQAAAQERTTVTRGTMTGAQFKEMVGHISDTIYNEKGKMIDSATAQKMLKSYEYGQTLLTYAPGKTKRIIKKFPANQAQQDDYIIKANQPESMRLWMGNTFDLSPLASRYDLSKLNNKALVVIFWSRRLHPYIARETRKERNELNEITTKYRDTSKFEVIAITHEKKEAAFEEMKLFPIENAFHVLAAPGTIEYYGTKEQPHIVVTDRQHKIIYSMKNWHGMTPRFVNGLLKNLK